ncbi:ribbon-helix-helix domain-containing protein [Geoglobus acetivorans]|uniref:Ribbon-helix-helix protein CopG domain-containing protein n=1 Tax=Geoglobus acetivorans TaxID=565033 RepID=A0A0A7GD23_GEOAI|nr:hypothetical protein GACE_0886 [Geoglobus acetivorans]
MPDSSELFRWLSQEKTMVSFQMRLDRLYLLDKLVKSGEFKSRSHAIVTAIEDLLRQYYPELHSELEVNSNV